MKSIEIFTLIFFGLFYFSEGKPCPEKTRPHKTRCDAYYKCQDIPPKAHVWIPSICDQGLIYEHNLKLCVLPEDDWECLLEDNIVDSKSPTDAPVLHITVTEGISSHLKSTKDSDIDIVRTGQAATSNGMQNDIDSIQLVANLSSEEVHDDDDYEGSGNGDSMMELNDVMQTETRETNDKIKDGDVVEHKTTESETSVPTSSKIDPKLTAHLQQLSQLIDGLKKSYQQQDNKQNELRPDQLNAFLAHFNIQNKFNSFDPSSNSELQQSIAIAPFNSSSRLTKFQGTLQNATDFQDQLSNNMKPETKLILSSPMSKRYGSSDGFSSSQIVVNHPEGSVLFSLPSSYGNDPNYVQNAHVYESYNSPKISEDTLKTVLELSKQMIATQNVPKVIQNSAFYPQPILQPVYLTAATFPNSHGSPFSSHFNNDNENNDNNDNDSYGNNNRYSSITNNLHNKPHGHSHAHNKYGQNSNNAFSKPSTTVIHNNIIPVHVTSTNSGEKEVIDSYGQSLGRYPPLNVGDNGNQGFQHHNHFSHLYEGNNFLTSFTTMRPSAATTPDDHFPGQYPSPYPTEISMTTVPSIISKYYTPSEHLNENNVHHLYQPVDRHPFVQYGSASHAVDSAQVERPGHMQQSLYGQTQKNPLISSQISSNILVRPSTQKVESMEENISIENVGYNEQPLMTNKRPIGYNNNNNDILNKYESMLGLGPNSNKPKHPYMPRPHTNSLGIYGSSLSTNNNNNKLSLPSYTSSASSHAIDGMQLVNVGGNFIRYDVFQNTILPMLGHSQNDELHNVEVITCATGIRQPNTTDCTRYYVCSKKDGKVLSYSCPPYTAFNSQMRICDAHTYAVCSPSAIINSYTVSENKRIQMEAFQALQDAKRRRDQAMKAQSISNLLLLNPTTSTESENSQEKDMLNAYVQQAAIMANMASSTTRPNKKRKYYCKEGDKIPDQTSIYSYFVCYKNAQGMMKGHKMTCSKGLLFCPKTTMCTLATKCS